MLLLLLPLLLLRAERGGGILKEIRGPQSLHLQPFSRTVMHSACAAAPQAASALLRPQLTPCAFIARLLRIPHLQKA
jgi:hypothetical protein